MADFSEETKLLNLYAHISYRVVIGCNYVQPLTGHDGKFWPYVQNSVIEATTLHWCHLFLDRDDALYYKRFFNRPQVSSVGEAFRAENVKSRLTASLGLDQDEYAALWKSIKDLRDQWIAHKDLDAKAAYPALDKCKLMAFELRMILSEWCAEAYKQHPDATTLYGWIAYFKQPLKSLDAEAAQSWEHREAFIKKPA